MWLLVLGMLVWGITTNPANITLGGHDILFNGRSFAYGMGWRGHIIDGVFVGSIELSDGLPEEKVL